MADVNPNPWGLPNPARLFGASQFHDAPMTGADLVHGLRAPPVVACRVVKADFAP